MSKLRIFEAKHSVADQTCQECGAKANLDYDPTTIAGKGNEAGFVYQRPILTCTDPECLEEFVAPEDSKELHDAFCQSAGLLMPEEIKAIREDYGKRAKNGKISQKNFALELGMGNSTIARYELRMQVQSKVHDLLLRACRELAGFDDLVAGSIAKDQKKNQFPIKEVSPLAEAYNQQNDARSNIIDLRARKFSLPGSPRRVA